MKSKDHYLRNQKKAVEALKEKYKDPEFMEKMRERNKRSGKISADKRRKIKEEHARMKEELQELENRLS